MTLNRRFSLLDSYICSTEDLISFVAFPLITCYQALKLILPSQKPFLLSRLPNTYHACSVTQAMCCQKKISVIFMTPQYFQYLWRRRWQRRHARFSLVFGPPGRTPLTYLLPYPMHIRAICHHFLRHNVLQVFLLLFPLSFFSPTSLSLILLYE